MDKFLNQLLQLTTFRSRNIVYYYSTLRQKLYSWRIQLMNMQSQRRVNLLLLPIENVNRCWVNSWWKTSSRTVKGNTRYLRLHQFACLHVQRFWLALSVFGDATAVFPALCLQGRIHISTNIVSCLCQTTNVPHSSFECLECHCCPIVGRLLFFKQNW